MADLESTKSMCRSILMASNYGVLASKFPREYEELTGNVLPLKALGIRSVNDLPRLMPDVIKAERNAQGQVVFYGIANEKTAHIAKMKSKEKSKSKKNRRPAGIKKIFFANAGSSGGGFNRNAGFSSAKSRCAPLPASRPFSRPAPRPAPARPTPQARPAPVAARPAPVAARPAPVAARPAAAARPAHAPRFQQGQAFNRAINQSVNIPSPARRAVPALNLVDKMRTLMSEFNQGLWSGKLVSEYETFFKEPAEPNLLELVMQMEGTVVRIERPYGQNNNKMILYGVEDDEEPGPPSPPPPSQPPTNGVSPSRQIKFKYPYTYRYVHAPLPWLGVRAECYVTLAHSPSYFWVQIKSEQLDDLAKISDLIQTSCEAAPPETHGRFYVDELVCGLFNEDQKWYRAIVLDVGSRHESCLDSLDPAMFLPNKPTPQFNWRAEWQVKLFFVDYGNIEWVSLNRVRRKKFPYPNGQAFRCSLGSITPTEEWGAEICKTFQFITENRDAESLLLTVEAMKSEKAHYGFKSRLNEYCQKRRLDMPTFAKPLNSDFGWRTSCTIKHPTKGYTTYQGFYQNKKNDAEASAAQHVIREWDINLLDSKDIPAHWIEVLLENKESKEVYNKSLVESGAATPKTSIYDMVIPKQPEPSEVPKLRSEMIASYTVDDSSEDSEEDSFGSEGDRGISLHQEDPELVTLPYIGETIYMYVTDVHSPKNICMRNIDKDNDRVLLDMEDGLTEFMRTNAKKLGNVQVNQLCAVYSEKICYRARVLRLKKNNKAEVLMLDYGDMQEYSQDELLFLDHNFLTLPYQAMSCCLFGLEKIIHAEQLTEFIKDRIEEHKFMVRIKDIVNERTLTVELYDDSGENMNTLFLSQDIRNLKPTLPFDGDSHVVKLTNVSSEGVLSLQISGPGLKSLGELMKELRAYYEENAPRASDYIVEPTPGQICCSCSIEEGERRWYRALINRNINDHTVEVVYVDYGHMQTIPKSKLREPAKAVPNISRLPFQAFSVRLADLPTSPGSWTQREVDTLKGYVADQTMIEAEVVAPEPGEEYPLVRIYLNSGPDEPPKELNKLLSTDRNLFQTPLLPSPSADKLSLNLGTLSLANPTYIDLKEMVLDQSAIPKLSLQRQAEALISHVDTPYSWFFQSREFHTQFREMGEEMNKFYSQPLDHAELLYQANNMCVAYCEQYQGWYRARVLQISPEGKMLECSMVDYGDVQKIPVSSVRPLTRQFAALPIQACRAALCGVMPVDGTMKWSKEAESFFSAAVSEKMLWVRLVAQEASSQILWMHIIDTSSDTDVYISNSLVDGGLAIRPPATSTSS